MVYLIGTHLYIGDKDLEDKVCNMFGKIGVNMNKHDIEAWHKLREKDKTIAEFANRKEYKNILKVKIDLKHLGPF